MGLILGLEVFLVWSWREALVGKAAPRYLRPGRSISVSAVPFGPAWCFVEGSLFASWWFG